MCCVNPTTFIYPIIIMFLGLFCIFGIVPIHKAIIKYKIMKNYIAPQMAELELHLEGSAMLTQSEYDEKNNTENFTWDDYTEL